MYVGMYQHAYTLHMVNWVADWHSRISENSERAESKRKIGKSRNIQNSFTEIKLSRQLTPEHVSMLRTVNCEDVSFLRRVNWVASRHLKMSTPRNTDTGSLRSFSTRQHTATHYNTPQHTTTHCNTLQQGFQRDGTRWNMMILQVCVYIYICMYKHICIHNVYIYIYMYIYIYTCI